MKHGVHIPNVGSFGSAQVVAELAATAEDAGWDGVFVWDHVVRRERDVDVVDPWVALTAAAVATDNVTLGPLITPLPRRRPWNVAKAAVSLDHLSGGRFVLGVGTGTHKGPEFAAFGEETDLRVRGDMLDEAVEVVRAVWSGAPVHFDGAHYRIEGVRFLPTTLRPAGIPIWAATESIQGRAVRRAATLDGVVPIEIRPADLPQLIDAVGRERVEGGTFDITVVSQGNDVDDWAAAGATWWLRELDWGLPLADAIAVVERGPV
jgi:alkanesulfonate monooxygenase SsuD/methylene tetrahydromethanopterin reductase-like flavin-dependent oxidoreductase (luciferase family)